jgi:hypothetical protein
MDGYHGRGGSAQKNAELCLMLWLLAEANGDLARVELARAGLRECGYPGGEGAMSLQEALAAVEAADASS